MSKTIEDLNVYYGICIEFGQNREGHVEESAMGWIQAYGSTLLCSTAAVCWL